MEFSSLLFLLFFLPTFLVTYYLTPKKYRNLTFLGFSIFFYAWGGPVFIFLMLLLCVVNFILVRQIEKGVRSKKVLLWITLLLNIGTLAYFKYANFFIENIYAIQDYFGMQTFDWQEVVLPMGISFFTFQSITYIMDVYQNKHRTERRLTDYMLFILSFPQMIAGPIVQYNEIAHEINGRKENTHDFLDGFLRFSIGLAKKVILANILAEQVDLILDHSSLYNGLTIWMAMIGYSFQIYFDFSGYSDMAVGLGKMVGFHFPENFNNPYTATSISDFWRKWHITLSTWMKNYLYIPLGGNRSKSKSRIYLNLWIVFLISGLWHGASWNFVIWGAFHGFFLILDRLFLLNWLEKSGKYLSILITFTIVTLGWVLFRMETLSDALLVYKKMFFINSELGISVNWATSFITIFTLAIVFSIFIVLPKGKQIQSFFFSAVQRTNTQQFILVAITFMLLLASITLLAPGGINPFIYTRF